MATTTRPIDRDVADSPLLWFGWMLNALDRGEYARAGDCQAELDRLGWKVTRRRRPNARKAAEGATR